MGYTSGARAAHLGPGQRCKRAHPEPGYVIGIWGGTAGVHTWSWDSTTGQAHLGPGSTAGARAATWVHTAGARAAHLELAQCIWVWGSAPPAMVRRGCSPAPSQPRCLPGMAVAAPLSRWFLYFPDHQSFLVPVKLASYLFLSSHGELRLSAPIQPALGQVGSRVNAHAWIFPTACSSLRSQNPVASTFLRGRLHCLGFQTPSCLLLPFGALCDLLRSSLEPDVQRWFCCCRGSHSRDGHCMARHGMAMAQHGTARHGMAMAQHGRLLPVRPRMLPSALPPSLFPLGARVLPSLFPAKRPPGRSSPWHARCIRPRAGGQLPPSPSGLSPDPQPASVASGACTPSPPAAPMFWGAPARRRGARWPRCLALASALARLS